MSHLEGLVRNIYSIVTSELNSKYDYNTHIEYIMYRLSGGELSEDIWLENSCKK